jgi:hypothetical protein
MKKLPKYESNTNPIYTKIINHFLHTYQLLTLVKTFLGISNILKKFMLVTLEAPDPI